MVQLKDFTAFDWDAANTSKFQRHGVSIAEIEQVLAGGATLIVPDLKNSDAEPRFLGIGLTAGRRYLFVVFTPRDNEGSTVLRPISARYMHRKEIKRYEQEIARLSKRSRS